MKIVRPFAITEANLTSSVPETASWNAITTYANGDVVSKGRRLWQSLQNDNTSHDPETDVNGRWLNLGPSEPWAMFDILPSTRTTADGEIEVTVGVEGFANTVALLNVDAALITITVSEDGNEVFSREYPMVDESAVVDYYEYFFEPIIRKTDLAVTNLPDAINPDITIKATDTDSVGIGRMGLGQSRYIGEAVYGASIGFIDSSRFEYDDFGIPIAIVERNAARTGRFTVWIPASLVDATYNLLTSYRATPVFIIGSEKYSSTFYFGLLKDVQIEIAYPQHSIMSLEARGF